MIQITSLCGDGVTKVREGSERGSAELAAPPRPASPTPPNSIQEPMRCLDGALRTIREVTLAGVAARSRKHSVRTKHLSLLLLRSPVGHVRAAVCAHRARDDPQSRLRMRMHAHLKNAISECGSPDEFVCRTRRLPSTVQSTDNRIRRENLKTHGATTKIRGFSV